MKKKAFTLVELSVSAVLLSMIVLAVTSIYSSSSKSFNASSWRMSKQKEAQQFLIRFKEAIEKSSNFNIIKADGNKEVGSEISVVVAGDYFNKIASSSNSGILFSSHCTPYVEIDFNLHGIKKPTKSVFKGFSLECYNRTLAFVQNSSTDILMKTITTYPLQSMPTLPNSNISQTNHSGDFIVTLGDVDSIRVNSNTVNNDLLLNLQIVMAMPKSNGKVTITEQITAKISDVRVEEGKPTYPTSSKRK